jgi:hypothetical protein
MVREQQPAAKRGRNWRTKMTEAEEAQQAMLADIAQADPHTLADIVVRLAALRAEKCNIGPHCWKCASVAAAWDAAIARGKELRGTTQDQINEATQGRR